MLRITFRETKNTIYAIDANFDLLFNPDWLNNQLVKDIILDVDNSKVISPFCIQSPVFGQIAPSKLSGGVKALILMLFLDKEISATACGDNCAKWILEISKIKDLTVCLEYSMDFPEPHFRFYHVDDGLEYWYDEFIEFVFDSQIGKEPPFKNGYDLIEKGMSRYRAEGLLDNNGVIIQ